MKVIRKIKWFIISAWIVPYLKLSPKQIYLWYVGLFSKFSHYRKDGNEKQNYPTKKVAIKAKLAMEKKNGGTFDYYKCLYCNGYHIGNRNF